MKITLTITGFLIAALSLQSQSITFFEKGTDQTVEGVFVTIADLQSGHTQSSVSDSTGTVHFEGLNFPVIIRAQHTAYKTVSDTLSAAGTFNIELTPAVQQLNDFVVTGQFRSQSAQNSVFSVKVIDEQELAARKAISLSEALSNTLNIRLSQDLVIGSTTVNLLGVSGQNVKILLDGVPLVNRNGNGNNADLSQINLNLIERIEIVEGPLAVNYGANALAGVINLITKKEARHQSEITLSIQEESAGQEYGLTAGRHIQNLAINQQLSNQLSAQFGLQRNDFRGFTGSSAPRQYEWQPKKQWQTNGLLRYHHDKYQLHYRLDYLDELITSYGGAQNNFLPNGENQPFAIDEEYHSQRLIHQIQMEARWTESLRFNGFLSYSDFERQKTRFSNNLVTGEKNLTSNAGDQDISTYRVFESGGTLSGPLSPDLNFQSGYQLTLEQVGGGRITDSEQSLQNLALYSSLEWQPTPALTLRPGARLAFNSSFGSQLISSFQARYSFGNKVALRVAYGRGFRSPSIRELYFEFVDSNHRIFGNPELEPELSHYVNANMQKTYELGAFTTKTELNGFFNSIEDQIGLAQSPSDATSVSYVNINKFRSLGARLSQSFESSRLSLSLGLAYTGRYNQLNDLEANDLKQYFYTPEANFSFSYRFPSSLCFNLFYKYSGALQSYVTADDSDDITVSQIESYHWLDFNTSKSLSKRFELTLGVRNLLDVKRINNTGSTGSAHSGGATVPVSYGRSYFIKLNYNLKIDE
jgi:outer membrane receptor for ferrienterochelin and colicins